MPLRLICGPTGSGKTHMVIEAFQEALDASKNPIFIAPSMPDARHFEREILRQSSSGALMGARVLTFGSLFQSALKKVEPGAESLNPAQRFLLMRAIVDRTDGLSALADSAEFDGFVTSLLDVFAELETLGIDARKLEVFRSWTQGHKWREALGRDIFRLYDDYLAAVHEQGVYDDELAQRRVIAAIADNPALLGCEMMIVDGFWDFTPLQHELMRTFSQAGGQLTVTLPFEQGNDRFASLQRHFDLLADGADIDFLASRQDDQRVPVLRHLGANLFRDASRRVTAADAVTLMLAAGPRGQAELVAAEILELARSGQSLDDIAIVCRSLGSDMDAMAATLRDFGVPYELTSPVPLKNTTVGRAALAVIDFISAGGGRSLMVTFLKNVPALAPVDKVDELDRQARTMGKTDAADLLQLWKKIGKGRLQPELERLRAAAGKNTGDLAKELCAVIGAAVRAGVADTDSFDDTANDLLACQCLQTVCAEAVEADAVAEKSITGISRKPRNAAALLRRGIAAAGFRLPAAVRRGCVRLLDPHRVLNQRFDIVFICGLLEKQFPNLGRENAFFSDADRRLLRERHGVELKTRETRLAEERFLFHRTLSRARRRVYLCHPYCDQEGKPTIPSLFVDDALALLEPEPFPVVERRISAVTFDAQKAPTRKQALRSLALYAGSHEMGTPQRQQLDDLAGPAGLGERLHVSIEASTRRCRTLTDPLILARLQAMDEFRVTELQRYLGCPFRYFVERLLDPQDMEPVAHSLRRGQIVHNILYEFGEQILMKAKVVLAKADDGQIQEALRQMQAAIGDAFADAGDDVETLIMKTELEYHLKRFLHRERQSGRYLKTYDLELSFGSTRGDSVGKQSTERMLKINDIKLKGRIDRVDWEDHNRAVVIDFKTSKNVNSWKDFQGKKDIQIPLYILALRDVFGFEPAGGEYYALRGEQRRGLYRDGSQEMLGAGSGQMDEKDFVDAEVFEQQLQGARDLAYDAAAAIRRGEFPCEPHNERHDCGYCDFGGICRLSEPKRIAVTVDDE